jgi:hypothetical protein
LISELKHLLLTINLLNIGQQIFTIAEYRRIKFERYRVIIESIVFRLRTRHSIAELLGLVANTGIFPLVKRVGKFLNTISGNIADLSQQDKERLCRVLDQSGSTKSRLIGVLALIVLYDCPPVSMTPDEQRYVAHIRIMMQNSLLNPLVVEFLHERLFWHNWSMAPAISLNHGDIDFKFDIFMRQFAWFHAAHSHRLLTNPAPRPASPVNQLPAIDNDVV